MSNEIFRFHFPSNQLQANIPASNAPPHSPNETLVMKFSCKKRYPKLTDISQIHCVNIKFSVGNIVGKLKY